MNKIDSLIYRHGKSLVGLIFLLMFAFALTKNYIEREFIIRTAKRTVGIVSEKSCSNHGRIGYSYSVGNNSYEVWESGSACGLVDCGHISIGDRINVTYSSAKPELATCALLGTGR
jgi:hypothetical protein